MDKGAVLHFGQHLGSLRNGESKGFILELEHRKRPGHAPAITWLDLRLSESKRLTGCFLEMDPGTPLTLFDRRWGRRVAAAHRLARQYLLPETFAIAIHETGDRLGPD